MGRGARALLAQDGATLTAADVRLTDVTGVGASAVSDGSRLSLDRVVIVGGGAPSQEPSFSEGIAVAAIFGGTGRRRRGSAWCARTRSGVFVYGEGASVSLERSRVEGVAGRSELAGIGAFAARGGCAHPPPGVAAREATGAALIAMGDGSRASLHRVVLEATQAFRTESAALQAQEGGVVEGARVVVRGNATAGVVAVGASRVTLSELRVADCDAPLGYGLAAQDGAEVTLTRARISRNTAAGVFVAGEGARLTLSDAVVEGPSPARRRAATGPACSRRQRLP